MASEIAQKFLGELQARWGCPRKLPKSNSLFEVAGRVRLYCRYSKLHRNASAFFGVRRVDLLQLEGFPSFICFLWDGQASPLVLPYEDFRDVFESVAPAPDGQYKVDVEIRSQGVDLRVRRAGCFGVDAYFGTDRLVTAVEQNGPIENTPDLSHSQVQTLLGAIGNRSGYAIWTPMTDRPALDFNLSGQFPLVDTLPEIGGAGLRSVMQQIDVLWLDARQNTITAAFEVEFSTPIYSGLLRFNDVYINVKLPERLSWLARSDDPPLSDK